MLKKIIGIASTIFLITTLNISFYNLPPLGKFLDPFNGYCALINTDEINNKTLIFPELHNVVEIVYDSLRIPHIFAKNEHDLFFIQGYVTAFDRLWQMEFQTYAAAGRLSEIIGEKTIGYDRFQRRIGMVYAAQNTLEEVKKDSNSYANLIAYTKGVNKYIESLNENKIPLEYKILNYKPEKWTLLKTSLLLKKMAWMLTGRNTDLVYTRIFNDFGEEVLNELFPIFPNNFEPIIPRGTKFNFTNDKKPPNNLYIPNADIPINNLLFPDKNIGSNNWAMHGTRTKNGTTLLSNDPHLGLSLPSIWYMTHLNCPTINVMGVTIPGAPGIVIGFNDNISWGVTNGNDDVMDWYDIKFKTSKKEEYFYDNNWLPIIRRIEEIKIKNERSFYDTVLYTHHGPIVWDYDMQTPTIGAQNSKYKIKQTSSNRALKWIAHEPSNELKAFFGINKSSNYNEFISYLNYYKCPGQNFVYADKKGDIGIFHSGSQPIKWYKQGIYIQDGGDTEYEWGEPIPHSQKPQIKNPRLGYVSSANQHPVDQTYPYFLSGGFWMSYRGIEINRNLDTLYNATINDMKNIQLNNKYGVAKNMLPFMLDIIRNDSLINHNDTLWISKLSQWNYDYDKSSIEATFFNTWLNKIEELTWFDDFGEEDSIYIWPNINILDELASNKPNSKWFDNKLTKKTETFDDIVIKSFNHTLQNLNKYLGDINESWEWGNYRGTDINHIAKIHGLGKLNLKTSGGPEIINATGKTFGPSFRYNIEMGDTIKTIGIYPGGQSGYPGSLYYDNFVDDWTNGLYYNLIFNSSAENIKGSNVICVPD